MQINDSSLITYRVEYDVLYQGEGKLEKADNTAFFTLPLDVVSHPETFLCPQDCQTMLEVMYPERIIEITAIERYQVK